MLIKHILVRTKPYMYKYLHIPATVKLSVTFSSVPLKHITVVSFLLIILDIATWSVEVKLACRLVPLTLMRVALSGPRGKRFGGVSSAVYEVN